ncbi:CoA pyrophosphatase [Variovorax sp. OV329]|uniref:NUDIX hydrolase n=1 Tax=Variovorax sp. OV329 TaxID=1882825 RepID=UPI0008F1A277|nr:CoA pyrophosphatase [Variovorax sp. OV329]SFN34913.1 ADP-ribose pyrophosphatase YjhB, NUDIX family [Variovorax sp. OV329]
MDLDDTLRELIAGRLARFDQRSLGAPDSRRAAVALALIEEGTGAMLPGIDAPAAWSRSAAMLLTRRSQRLRNHPGQWALPGGSIDGSESPEEAALRELHEEVGLRLEQSAVLGRLDDFVTRSGFSITPVVVWAGEAYELEPNAGEVASIHRIPLSEFMRTDAPWLDPIEDSEQPVLRMPVGLTWIAAPTAAFIYQFREVCIAGRATRVAHFEQPMFARQ